MRSLLISTLLLLSWNAFSQKKVELTQEEKEKAIIDYSNIKKVLQTDGLSAEKAKKDKLVETIKKERKKIISNRERYPSESDFFMAMSELWLVKNAQILSWDFPKPEYGIAPAFRGLLEKFGYYNIEYKILIVNSPTVTHFGLPSGDKSYIFIISLPFIRSLDLTKVDISLLLLEDFIRLKQGFFLNNLKVDTAFLKGEISKKKSVQSKITEVLKRYSKVVLEEGFDFQQQYETVKQVDQLLKSAPELWGAYFKLYKKIDRFIKSDLLYKGYLKVYPSPELQLQWLAPKKKVI